MIRLSRRRFVAGCAAVAVIPCGYARFVEPRRLMVRKLRYPGTNHFPAGSVIGQLSDLHFRGDEPMLAQLVEAVRAAKPDVLVLTGDLVDSSAFFSSEALTIFLTELARRVPTIAIPGNWEYWAKIPMTELRSLYERTGVTFLLNEWTEVKVRGQSIAVYGSDDPLAGKPNPRVPDARPDAIVLCHCPGFVPTLLASYGPARPALVFSGHTHGGQVRLPFVPPLTPPLSGPFVSGWYTVADTPFFVSSGVGTSVIAARFGVPPEFVTISFS